MILKVIMNTEALLIRERKNKFNKNNEEQSRRDSPPCSSATAAIPLKPWSKKPDSFGDLVTT